MRPTGQGPAVASEAGGRGSFLVLIVCAANTARSVMAEHLLRLALERRGAAGLVAVRSAGIAPYARDGALVSLDARMALQAQGIALPEDQTSTDLKRHPELLAEADLVLAMTAEQAALLNAQFPVPAGAPVATLGEFAGRPGDIADPAEKGSAAFAACCRELAALIPGVAERVLQQVDEGSHASAVRKPS